MPGGGDRTHRILRSLDFKSLGASLSDCEAECNKIGQLKRWQLVSVPILECPASMLRDCGEQSWIAAARCGKHSFLTEVRPTLGGRGPQRKAAYPNKGYEKILVEKFTGRCG